MSFLKPVYSDKITKAETLTQLRDVEDDSTRWMIERSDLCLEPFLDTLIENIKKNYGISGPLALVKYIDLKIEDSKFSRMCLEYFTMQRYTEEEVNLNSIKTAILRRCVDIRNKSTLYKDEVNDLTSQILELFEKLKTLENSDIILTQLTNEAGIQTGSTLDKEDLPF